MSERNEVTLDEVVALKRGFDLPEPRRRPGIYPVLGSSGVSGWHDEGPVKGPGVTIGRSGASIGVATYFAGDFWPLNTTLFVENFKGNSPRYIYYLFRSIDFASFDSGSAQPSLNRNYIANIKIMLPERGEQEAIARLLGALDDRIFINDRIAETALELALAKYKELVSANRLTNLTVMADCGRWLSGGTPETSEQSYWGGDIPWISASSLKVPWIDDSDRKVTTLGSVNGTRLVPSGTIIFVVRGMSLVSEFRIGLTQREVAFGQDCKALLPAPWLDATVLFVAIKSQTPNILRLVDSAGHGTGRLATDLLTKVELSLPEVEFSADVAARLRPLIVVGAARQAETRSLRDLRDTLLPRLVSGEIRVQDAEKVVEDVT